MSLNVPISKRLVYVNATSSMVTRLLQVFVLVWLYQYLLDKISPEEFAIYPVVTALMLFAPLLSTVLTGGIVRYVVDASARGEEQRVVRIISSIFPPLIFFSALFLGLGALAVWKIEYLLNLPPDRINDARWMMAMLVVDFVLTVITVPFRSGIEVKQMYVLFNLIQLGQEVLRSALLFGLIFGMGPRVVWVVLANFIATKAAMLGQVVVSMRHVPQIKVKFSEFHWDTFKEVTSFGIWSTMGQLAFMLHRGSGPIVLNRFALPGNLAYSINSLFLGSEIYRQIGFMTTMASAPLQPALTAMHSTGDHARLGRAYLRGGRLAVWVTMMVAVPLVIFRHELVDFYTKGQYMDAAPVILLLMLILPFNYASAMLPKIAAAKAKLGYFTVGTLIAELFSLALKIYLVIHFRMGAIGIAASMLATTALVQVVYFWPLGLRMCELKAREFITETLLPGLIPSLGGLAACMGLYALHKPQNWFELIGMCALGTLGYLATLFLFAMREADRNDLDRALARFTGKKKIAEA